MGNTFKGVLDNLLAATNGRLFDRTPDRFIKAGAKEMLQPKNFKVKHNVDRAWLQNKVSKIIAPDFTKLTALQKATGVLAQMADMLMHTLGADDDNVNFNANLHYLHAPGTIEHHFLDEYPVWGVDEKERVTYPEGLLRLVPVNMGKQAVKELRNIKDDDLAYPMGKFCGWPTMYTGDSIVNIYTNGAHAACANRIKTGSDFDAVTNALASRFGEPYVGAGQRGQLWNADSNLVFIDGPNDARFFVMRMLMRSRSIYFFPKWLNMCIHSFVVAAKLAQATTTTHSQDRDFIRQEIRKNIASAKRMECRILSLDGSKSDRLIAPYRKQLPVMKSFWIQFGQDAYDLVERGNFFPIIDFFKGQVVEGAARGTVKPSGIDTTTPDNNVAYYTFVMSSCLLLSYCVSKGDKIAEMNVDTIKLRAFSEGFDSWCNMSAAALEKCSNFGELDAALRAKANIKMLFITGDDVTLSVAMRHDNIFDLESWMTATGSVFKFGKMEAEPTICMLGEHFCEYDQNQKHKMGKDIPPYAMSRVVTKTITPERIKEYPYNAVGIKGRLDLRHADAKYETVVDTILSSDFQNKVNEVAELIGNGKVSHLRLDERARNFEYVMEDLETSLKRDPTQAGAVADMFNYVTHGDTEAELPEWIARLVKPLKISKADLLESNFETLQASTLTKGFTDTLNTPEAKDMKSKIKEMASNRVAIGLLGAKMFDVCNIARDLANKYGTIGAQNAMKDLIENDKVSTINKFSALQRLNDIRTNNKQRSSSVPWGAPGNTLTL